MHNSSATTSVKTLFLDIGGVLLTNGWSRSSRETAAQKFGFDFVEMETRHDLAFPVYEIGHMNLDAYLESVLFYKERPFAKEEFIAFMQEESQPLPGMLEGLVRFRQQHPQVRIFALNNEPKELHSYRVKRFSLRRIFDGFVTSCFLGLRKPDPALYQAAIGIAGVAPKECLYIDDREALVEAGSQQGLQTWLHKDCDETFRFLQERQWASGQEETW